MNTYESIGIKLLGHLNQSDGKSITVRNGQFDGRAMNMMNLDWFIGRMKKTFNIEVLEGEVSCEVYSFRHDELVNLQLPIENLPNSLLFEKIMYVDKKGNEWIAGIVLQEETRKIFYELWMKNGEPIAYELYDD